MPRSRVVLLLGILLVALGVAGLAHPNFTYHKKEQVAKLGPIQATLDEEKAVQVPVALSIAAVAAGLALVILAPRLRPE
jgi:uncharacterized membrane protein HdeD (DUF308 family)